MLITLSEAFVPSLSLSIVLFIVDSPTCPYNRSVGWSWGGRSSGPDPTGPLLLRSLETRALPITNRFAPHSANAGRSDAILSPESLPFLVALP